MTIVVKRHLLVKVILPLSTCFILNCQLPVSSAALPSNSNQIIAAGVPASASSSSSTRADLNTSLVAQQSPGLGTVLPTDVMPSPLPEERSNLGQTFEIRALQSLPASLYINFVTETTLRDETNPFQFPNKATLIRQLAKPGQFQQLNAAQQQAILNEVRLSDRNDGVFRVLPNITIGWALNPTTRVFGNYFLLRDSLLNNVSLNTVIQSVSYGAQKDFRLSERASVQVEGQFRELYQSHLQPVFDFLPATTLTYIPTANTALFANAILQLRGKQYFQAPSKELDPFYTVGAIHNRGRWQFTASTTFVQNFRDQFGAQAIIRSNNYAFISDFEIARRIVKQLPGVQAFVRVEPIFNFHSHNTPGIAGVDFRIFGGLRVTIAKRALTTAIQQIREDLEEQEQHPSPSPLPSPNQQGPANKPSADNGQIQTSALPDSSW